MIIDRPKAMSAPPLAWSAQEEAAIVARAREGDAAAIGQLYRRYAPGIYSYLASRLGDPAASEDLTSEVFERALEGLPHYEQRGPSIASWLYRIAHDRLTDHLRRRAQRPTLPLDERTLPAQEGFAPQVDARLAGEQLAGAVLGPAIAQLTAEQQQVIALRFYADLKLAEIAYVMDRSTEAIKMLQCRALIRLRELVGHPSEGYYHGRRSCIG
jgi:RNA polymerase sigma-70 factor (ECF subfamily)